MIAAAESIARRPRPSTEMWSARSARAAAAPKTSRASTAPGTRLLRAERRAPWASIVALRLSTYSRGALASGAAPIAWPAKPHSRRWSPPSFAVVRRIPELSGTSSVIAIAWSVYSRRSASERVRAGSAISWARR